METRPPEMIAKIVRALVPPASREHVLGDLQERYVSPRRYLFDALQALPFIIASRLRRTTHPLGLLLVGAFIYWAVFWGNRQASWAVALIPTLIILFVLALRDVYRGPTAKWSRVVALDMAIAAAGVLLSQGVLALVAPSLLLDRMTLAAGFPAGLIVLFFMRLQSPTGHPLSLSFARALSMQELRAEITNYETTSQRAIRIEIGACIVVALFFAACLWAAVPLIVKIGCAYTSAAALFVWWFLHRNARVRPIPGNLGFAETIAAYRIDLERRRHLSRTFGWWYVLPLVSGLAFMTIGPQVQRSAPLRDIALSFVVIAGVAALLVVLQRSMARKAQVRIDQLGEVSEKAQAG